MIWTAGRVPQRLCLGTTALGAADLKKHLREVTIITITNINVSLFNTFPH